MTLAHLPAYALLALVLVACSGDSGGTDTDGASSTSAGSTSAASTSSSSTADASSTTADTTHGTSSSTSAATTDATTGTTGGGATFPCGDSLTCDVATQYCEVIHPGQPDGMITYTCQAIPDACLDMADCACLMDQMIMGECSVTPEGGLKVLFFAP